MADNHYNRRILLSQDVYIGAFAKYGGFGYGHLLSNICGPIWTRVFNPFSEIPLMTFDNPQAFFARRAV